MRRNVLQRVRLVSLRLPFGLIRSVGFGRTRSGLLSLRFRAILLLLAAFPWERQRDVEPADGDVDGNTGEVASDTTNTTSRRTRANALEKVGRSAVTNDQFGVSCPSRLPTNTNLAPATRP